MSGYNRLTSARTRRWHGGWRLQRRRVLLPLRLLRLLPRVLSLEWVLAALILLIMMFRVMSPTLLSPQLPEVVPQELPQPRRCTSRATTMQISWGR